MTLAVDEPDCPRCDVEDVRIAYRCKAQVEHFARLAPAGSAGTPP
jgi:hypothetical protein